MAISGLSTRFRTYPLKTFGMQLSIAHGRNRRAHFVLFGDPDKDRSMRTIGRRAAASHLRYNRSKQGR